MPDHLIPENDLHARDVVNADGLFRLFHVAHGRRTGVQKAGAERKVKMSLGHLPLLHAQHHTLRRFIGSPNSPLETHSSRLASQPQRLRPKIGRH
jgi:hypothetical protein